jgi:hypothetical protein
MATFPGGSGVRQGAVAGMPDRSDPVNYGGAQDVDRPQPTDPGGTNNAGFMKTADYPYLDGDSGPFRQT